jgi:uncharacterized DUF497 family protein
MFEWDSQKAEANYGKHGVRFSEAEPVFEDDFAVTIPDDGSDPDEGAKGEFSWWCTAIAARTSGSSPRGWRGPRNAANTRRRDEGEV